VTKFKPAALPDNYCTLLLCALQRWNAPEVIADGYYSPAGALHFVPHLLLHLTVTCAVTFCSQQVCSASRQLCACNILHH
jgi:hypothetical protein